LDTGDLFFAYDFAGYAVLALTDDYQSFGSAQDCPCRSEATDDSHIRLCSEHRSSAHRSGRDENKFDVKSLFLEKTGFLGDPDGRHGDNRRSVECRECLGLARTDFHSGDRNDKRNEIKYKRFPKSRHCGPLLALQVFTGVGYGVAPSV
jgi:hypothetical protein